MQRKKPPELIYLCSGALHGPSWSPSCSSSICTCAVCEDLGLLFCLEASSPKARLLPVFTSLLKCHLLRETFLGPSVKNISSLHTLSPSSALFFIFFSQPLSPPDLVLYIYLLPAFLLEISSEGWNIDVFTAVSLAARTVSTGYSEKKNTYAKGDSDNLQKVSLKKVAKKKSHCYIQHFQALSKFL